MVETGFQMDVVNEFINRLSAEQRTALKSHPKDESINNLSCIRELTKFASITVPLISHAYAVGLVIDAMNVLQEARP